MRLNKNQIEFIEKYLPNSEIYIFGSILKDEIKGVMSIYLSIPLKTQIF